MVFCETQSSEAKIIDEQRGNGDTFYRHIFLRGEMKNTLTGEIPNQGISHIIDVRVFHVPRTKVPENEH